MRREVDAQHVGLDDVDAAATAAYCVTQAGGEVAVDLDQPQLARALGQQRGERAQPGADLDDALRAGELREVDDAPRHAGVRQKVLAEALARPAAEGLQEL